MTNIVIPSDMGRSLGSSPLMHSVASSEVKEMRAEFEAFHL